MHIEVIQTDNHPTGAGQMATPLVAPAIAGAVAELTGVRLRHTPFTAGPGQEGAGVAARAALSVTSPRLRGEVGARGAPGEGTLDIMFSPNSPSPLPAGGERE